MTKNALVIGYGSIGQRHDRILQLLGYDVTLISVHDRSDRSFESLQQCPEGYMPDVVAICSETKLHEEHLRAVLGRFPKAKVMLEKPLGFLANAELIHQKNVYVGYNLRFHPLFSETQKCVDENKVVHANMMIGRNLKTMRKGRDYKDSYSCYKHRGGGVLQDFSHDIDMALSFFGECHRLVAHGGHLNFSLHGDSDDQVTVMMEMEKCRSVVLQLSYSDHVPRRVVELYLEQENRIFDFDKPSDDQLKLNQSAYEDSYIQQWKFILTPETKNLCNLSQAMMVERFIVAVEQSLLQKRWIEFISP